MTQPTPAQAAQLYARAGWPVIPLHQPCNGGYTWHRSRRRLTPFRGWIVQALERQRQRQTEQQTPDQVRQAMRRARPATSRCYRYGQVALAGEVVRVANAPNGDRNSTLNTAAYRLGRLIVEAAATEFGNQHRLAGRPPPV
ncbi:MAG: hypothetical protein GEU81_17925 [Nitriliruptorales bacterium]|nr:hypothetical protein [Nitriliruptorales bacterium]